MEKLRNLRSCVQQKSVQMKLLVTWTKMMEHFKAYFQSQSVTNKTCDIFESWKKLEKIKLSSLRVTEKVLNAELKWMKSFEAVKAWKQPLLACSLGAKPIPPHTKSEHTTPKVRESWNCVFHGWENASTSSPLWPRAVHKSRWFGKSLNVNSSNIVLFFYAYSPGSVLIKFSKFEASLRSKNIWNFKTRALTTEINPANKQPVAFADDFDCSKSRKILFRWTIVFYLFKQCFLFKLPSKYTFSSASAVTVSF